jgi:transcriptional regulator with XRE-family HTH domain
MSDPRGTGLRQLREKRGLTLEALAYLAGDDVNVSTISRIERGLTEPRRETVVRLARALGISVNRLTELLSAEVPQ